LVNNIKVKILSYTNEGPRIVAASAKVSLSRRAVEPWSLSEEEIETWIKELIRRGHGSPLEHSSYTFSIEGCSRVCTHQLVRHRLASYTQQSMRYSEGYLREQALKAAEALGRKCPRSPKKDPSAYRCYSDALKEASRALEPDLLIKIAKIAYVMPSWSNNQNLISYSKELLLLTSYYYELLSKGVPREEARYIIPQAVRTNIVVTMNARELIESFLPLRMCTRAQLEIRRVAWLVWKELMNLHPMLFKWAGPRCVYFENKVRHEPCSLCDFIKGSCDFSIERCPELVPRAGIRECLKFAARSVGIEVGDKPPS
jgi:thymidylate synthase (FAD)